MNPRRSQGGARDLDARTLTTGSGGRSAQGRRWKAILAMALLASGGGDANATESLTVQRAAFVLAEQVLRIESTVDLTRLQDYPLYPYLRYQALSRRLPEFPAAEIRAFLDRYAESPLASRLRDAWLRQLAAAQRWPDYLRDFQPTQNAELDCWRRQALLAAHQDAAALRDFATWWTRGVALPTACDPVIAAWNAQGQPSPALRWQRFALAMERDNQRLARALRAAMPAGDQARADLWLRIAANPRLVLETTALDFNDPRTATMLSDGLYRWSKRNAPDAAAALDLLKARAPTLASPLAPRERQLALWLASEYHSSALARLTALPEAVIDRDVAEWRVRICLRQGDWNAAQQWLDRLPAPERASPRWQYWRGRVLELLGHPEAAKPVYRTIAGQRDYHGFLAADRLGTSYTITDTPLSAANPALEALLRQSPGLQRARELYILGRETDASSEWQHALRAFDRARLLQAALLAQRWEWYAQAIATLARAEHWDALDVRFPLAYRDAVLSQATASAVAPAWIYAVIRQESAFRANARSPVGALGLMQIMPATGHQIAQELREPLSADPPLLQPETSIRYGAHYLRHLLERLQDNPVLATAAYNAGPNKVGQWLPTANTIPADVWTETIPYRETRAYVQRVLEYLAIYQRRLGPPAPEPSLDSRMKPVLPVAASSQSF